MNKPSVVIGFAIILFFAISPTSSLAQKTGSASPDLKLLHGTSTGAGLSNMFAPSLFDGSTNVAIPIYQFNHGDADYGVSLSYNTKGIPVDEPEGPAGLHWNLNTGPSITRVMRDLPDDLYMITDSLLSNYGDNDTFLNHEMYLKGKLVTYAETSQQQSATNVYRDGECDEFIVSLGTATFSLYIGNGFAVFTNPRKNIKVRFLADGVPITDLSTLGEHLLDILITDEQGNKYYFVPGDYDHLDIRGFTDWQAANKEGDLYSYRSTSYVTRWVPKTITLADGNKIEYSYTDPTEEAFYAPNKSYYTEEDGTNYTWLGVDASNRYDEYVLPLSIQYPNGVKTDFIYDGAKKNAYKAAMLQSIRISSDTNCLNYKLYMDSVNARWYLNKVTIASCDGKKEEPYYAFGYNSLKLPPRLNSAQDFFGYYNGAPLGTHLGSSGDSITIPRHGTGYGNDRAYNPAFAAAGLLTQMKNAYGGEVDFYYGLNTGTGQLSNLPTDSRFVGTAAMDGVRIDSTVELDRYHPGNRKTTVYTYSGGQLFITGGYFHFPKYIDSASNEWTKIIFQSNFLTAHQLVNGSSHGYSSVSVKTYSDGALLSRRDYTFTNLSDATSNNQPRYYKVAGSMDFYAYPYTDKQYLKDWEIGLPLTITDYDQNNRLLQKTTNTYRFTPVDLSASSYVSNTKTVSINSGTLAEGTTGYLLDVWTYYPYKKIFTDTYYPYRGKALLTQTVTQKYVADSRFVADTVWYGYDHTHNDNMDSIITQNSNGQKILTHLVYNYDVDGPVLPLGYVKHPGTTLYNMTDSGLEKVVSTERWILTSSTTLNRLTEASITVFNYEDGKLWTKGMLNTAIGTSPTYGQYSGAGTGNPYGLILLAYNTSTPVSNFLRTSQVTLYDYAGNPEETQANGQDMYKAMVWNPNTGEKLAEAQNARYADIAYCGFDEFYPSSVLGVSATVGNLSFYSGYEKGSPSLSGMGKCYALTATIAGKPACTINGTQNLSAAKTYRLSFWANGAKPVIKAGTTTIPAATITPVYTKGSWTCYQVQFQPSAAGKLSIARNGSNTTYLDEIRLYPLGAQMESWTYDALFGVRSHTDATGHYTWQEYDNLGKQAATYDMDDNVLSATTYLISQ